MWVGIGVGIGRNRFATGIFNAYALRVTADGGITEAGQCVDAVTGILLNASLLLIPSGYKGGKLYAEIPTNGNGDLTWTRGGDAFRTNASGVIQRVPWNLATYSESFDNVAWSKTNATITANSTTAPNGTLTADTIVSIGADGRALQAFNVLENQNYTFSVWLKSTTSSNVNAAIRSAGNASSIVVTPEWQRFTITQSYPAAATRFPGISGIANNESVFIWGAQLVEGTTAQTYLPTTDRLNFPRLSYMYGSCPSALLEPQRTNLLTYSQAFNDATWAKVASIGGSITATDNYNASPDGNTNASRLLITNLNSAYVAKSFTSVNGSSYTISIWAKSNTASSYTFQLRDGYSGVVSSNLTVTPTWQRFTLTFTASGTTAELQFRTLVIGSYDLSIYGAQAELGAYPTTYIPTTGSATATRVADSFSRNNIYTNGLISASGGTWFVELRNNIAMPRVSGYPTLYISSNTVGTSTLTLGFASNVSATRLVLYSWISGAFTSIGTLSTDNVKVAFAFTTTTLKVFVNGSVFASYTGLTIDPTTIQNLIGNSEVTMFIQQMALFNSALTDAQCQTLTT